jgi:hypothetical protein
MPKKIVKDGKETTVFDVTNEEDMKIAEKLAKAQLVANEGGQSKEEFEKQAEKEEIEGRKLFEGMKKKAEEMYAEKGLNAPKIDSEEALTQAIENISRIEKLEQKSEGGSGSAPLNQQQITGGVNPKEGYNSQQEMIEDLQSRSRLGDSQAQAVLCKLLEKSLKGVKENKRGFGEIKTQQDGETEIQRLNRIWREKQLRNRNRD